MKKLTLFLLMAALLSSIFTIGVSAEQTNMEVKVPRLAGRPVFDGSITEAEWGKKTIRMVTEGAATEDSEEIGCNEELGLRNTFYYYTVYGLCDTLAYDLWIRWDDDYLYVAAIVEDPDPFSLPMGDNEIWNGDCIQIRVDERGPSAIMLASDPNFNYKTDAFNVNRFKKPWSNDKEVFNGIMGMVKGSTPTFWRCGKIYGEGWDLKNDGGLVGINVKRNSDDTCTITYEGAIPWKAVNETLIPKAGDIYGMGVSVYCSDSDEIGGMLQWGSGVGFVEQQPRATRGGSQAILLTNEKVGGSGSDNGTVTEPSFTKYGDANGDGSITLTDASTILKHIAKWNVYINTKASDVTNDGNISLSDVSRILQYIAKWSVALGPDSDDNGGNSSGDSGNTDTKLPDNSSAFTEFVDMITETEYVWHKTESIDFKTMPVSEIIDEVILAWPYYEYAFYYYYDLTPPKKVSDPLNKFSGYTVEFDTAGIHRILKNVFGREPDYKDGEYHYYHNNKLYVRDRLGIGDYGYRLDSTKLVNKTYLGNGKYTITVASKFYEKGSNNKEELCSYNYKFTVKPIKGTDGKYTWLMESYENLSK